MNGVPRGEPQNMSPSTAQVNSRPAHQPPVAGHSGIISNVTAALRILQTHNSGVLDQAIAQLETIHEIQNELVNARAAYSQVSSDLRKAVDQNLAQATELQKSRDELRAMNVRLHGAREQLLLLEKKLGSTKAEAAAGERQLGATREAEKDKQIAALTLALQTANAHITTLNGKLKSVAAAAGTAGAAEQDILSSKALEASTFSLRDLDQWLSSSSKQLDDATAKAEEMTALLVEPAKTPESVSFNSAETLASEPNGLTDESKNEIARLVKTSFQTNKDQKQQMLSQLKSLRAQYSNVLDIARTSVSRNLALETAFKTIRVLDIEVVNPTPEPPVQVDGDIEMDEERTEAAKATRLANNHTPSMKSATMSPAISSATSQPPTPSQPVFTFDSASPQRKRQRTSTGSATPEPLPQDDELYGLVRLIHTAYDIRGAQYGPKQLVCKACDARHKTQPGYPATSYEYGQDQKITMPILAAAEQTRTQIRPWVTHLQEAHQKLYVRFMQDFRRQVNARRASITPSN